MKHLLFSILIVNLFSKGFSQDTIRISRAELEARSLEQNLQIKQSKAEADLAQTELLATRASYLPDITASYTFTSTNNPLMAFGSKLNQQRITATDFDPDRLNNPKNTPNFATKVEIMQPIINMDAVYQKRAAIIKTNVLRIKTERTREYIQFELKKAYMALQLAYKMAETLENAKKTTLANKKVVDNYYKNGMIQKSEVLYMEVRISEIDSQMQTANSAIRNASDFLFFLLNENSDGKILTPEEPLEYQQNLAPGEIKLNTNRKDLDAFHQSLKAYEWLIKSSKSKFMPRLQAFGTWEMYDKKIARFDAGGYLVGLQLSWNFFDGLRAKSEQQKYKSEHIKAEIEIEHYTRQSELELSKTLRSLQDSDARIQHSKKAWEQSQEAYRIRKNRYGQGLEKSADLLAAETVMSQKELEYEQAVFEYNTTSAYLEFLKQ